MSQSTRLLKLMQVLRPHQRPVAAERLAERTGVSMCTVYRDIQAMVGLGAAIEGSAGVGYLLRSGFFLAPLTMRAIQRRIAARPVIGSFARSMSAGAAMARSARSTSSRRPTRGKPAHRGTPFVRSLRSARIASRMAPGSADALAGARGRSAHSPISDDKALDAWSASTPTTTGAATRAPRTASSSPSR
jgi:predicted DNA-binding transcriptional regulator YafY